jgi:hypothetical protein
VVGGHHDKVQPSLLMGSENTHREALMMMEKAIHHALLGRIPETQLMFGKYLPEIL